MSMFLRIPLALSVPALVALTALSTFAGDFLTQPGSPEARLTGQSAVELYAALNLPETPVADEHGGPAYAVAKYGKRVGCQKDLADGRVECWFIQAR